MRLWSRPGLVAAVGVCLGLFALLHRPGTVSGFTQGVRHAGLAIPVGHEWITRQAAIELFDPAAEKDKTDPRNGKDWKPVATNLLMTDALSVVAEIRSKKSSDSFFQARYSAVYDAILGERWVDIGGINFAKAKLGTYNCIDLVTQEPPDVQYDHFMRRHDDVDGAGGVKAAKESRQRFIDYFVNAATAPDGPMRVWDGGAYAEEQSVDRHYFLFGRALHLLEDSFSSDHTVRIKDDGYKSVRQVKSYLCAEGSEQHAHKQPNSMPVGSFYETGDVIWDAQLDVNNYKPSNMKPLALAATEATKEAWAAFIRTMAAPLSSRAAVARREATAVSDNWLSFGSQEMTDWYMKKENQGSTYVQARSSTESGWGGTTQAACMKRDWEGTTQEKKLKEFEDGRKVCIYNMVPTEGTENDRDKQLHIPFLWDWRKAGLIWQDPPKGFEVREVDSGKTRITLINKHRNAPLCGELPGLRLDNDGDKCAPVQLAVDAQSLASTQIEAVDLPGHYFGEEESLQHRVRLYTKGRTFKFKRRADGYYNIVVLQKDGKEGHHLHSTDGYPVLTGIDENHESALWQVNGLPEFDLAKGWFSVTAVVAGEERDLSPSPGDVLGLGLKAIPHAGISGAFYLEGEKNLYTMKLAASPTRLIRENKGTHRLELNDKSGDTFRVFSPRGDGYFYIQTASGYWGAGAKDGPIETNSAMPCGQGAHNVISGGSDDCDKNGRLRGPVPLLFRFKRIYL